jgi:hypothetical protein
LLIALAIGAIGCGSVEGNVFEPAKYPSVRIAASEAPVTLLDARRHVIGKRTFDTPFMSLPDDNEAKEIALHPRTRDAMQARMQRDFVPFVNRALLGGSSPTLASVKS